MSFFIFLGLRCISIQFKQLLLEFFEGKSLICNECGCLTFWDKVTLIHRIVDWPVNRSQKNVTSQFVVWRTKPNVDLAADCALSFIANRYFSEIVMLTDMIHKPIIQNGRLGLELPPGPYTCAEA